MLPERRKKVKRKRFTEHIYSCIAGKLSEEWRFGRTDVGNLLQAVRYNIWEADREKWARNMTTGEETRTDLWKFVAK